MRKIVRLTATFDVTDLPSFDTLKPYALTYKEEIDIIDDKADAPQKTVARLPHGHPSPTCIMENYTPQGVFLEQLALTWVRKRQPLFQEQSITPTMSGLVRQGYVERLEQGKYRFAKPMPGVKILGAAHGS